MTHCIFCNSKLDHVIGLNKYYLTLGLNKHYLIYCNHKLCDSYKVKYLFTDKELVYISYSFNVDKCLYSIYYYSNLPQLDIYPGIEPPITIFLQKPLECVITPFNFKNKLPMIMTYC